MPPYAPHSALPQHADNAQENTDFFDIPFCLNGEGCSWTVPEGGFFVWLTVPDGVDTKAMLPRAVTARVAYASGTGFYADGFGSRQLRLSFCYPTPERITEGVRRLAAVLEAELDVVRTFGTSARTELARGPQTPSPDTN